MSKDDFVGFGGNLAVDAHEFNLDAILAPNILYICMTRREKRIADELSKQFGGFERVIVDVDGERHEFSADSFIRLLESYESYSQVPELGKRENGGERESYAPPLDVLLRCLENDYGIRASWDGLRRVWFTESANAELDFIEDKSRYAELFGTPERAAQTLITVRKECEDIGTCYPNCPFDDAPACPSSIEPRDYDALLEWLRGDAE